MIDPGKSSKRRFSLLSPSVAVRRLKSFVRFRLKILRITFYSLFYNSHLITSQGKVSTDYVFDTLIQVDNDDNEDNNDNNVNADNMIMFQPAFWFVDNFTLILGPVFVISVTFFTVSIWRELIKYER